VVKVEGIACESAAERIIEIVRIGMRILLKFRDWKCAVSNSKMSKGRLIPTGELHINVEASGLASVRLEKQCVPKLEHGEGKLYIVAGAAGALLDHQGMKLAPIDIG
jgi:hypothetical protein